MSELAELLPDVATLVGALDRADYLADEALSTSLFLAARMSQPILLEGEPGVGKTEAAKALASALETPLIRLQCYEGLTSSEALYEWNYPRQLLAIRLAEARGGTLRESDLFSAEYLLERPLLSALDHPGPRPAVLLIDEVDRGDDEFEAFLFELLAESAVTIPELGTRRAAFPPVVVLTSNRTRDLHDALKRRCLYHWIDYPDTDRVAAIIRRRVPAAAVPLAGQVAAGVGRLRGLDLAKPPGVAEAISWTAALHVLGAEKLDEAAAEQTAGAVLKYAEDLDAVRDAGFALRWSATMANDLAEVAARFGAALRLAGLPVGPGRCERFAAAVTLARPQTPRALYLCAARHAGVQQGAGRDAGKRLQRRSSAAWRTRPASPAAPAPGCWPSRLPGRPRTCWPARRGQRESMQAACRRWQAAGRSARRSSRTGDPAGRSAPSRTGSSAAPRSGWRPRISPSCPTDELTALAGPDAQDHAGRAAARAPAASGAGAAGRAPTCGRRCARPAAPAATRSA